MKVVVDTSVLIAIERKIPTVMEHLEKLEDVQAVVSCVSIAEIMAGVFFLNKKQQADSVKQILSQFTSSEVTEEIAHLAAQMRARSLKKGNPGSLIDDIIAATAIQMGANAVITLNKRHFPEVAAKTLAEF